MRFRSALAVGVIAAVGLTGCGMGAIGGTDRYGIGRPGLQWISVRERDAALDRMQALGTEWVRIDIAWSDVQRLGPTTYRWDAYDELVDAIEARGLKILAVISYSPPWASDAPGPHDLEHKARWERYAPSDPEAYGRFAGIVADRYRGRVEAYEIWNEANIDDFFKPAPNAAKYAAMLRAAYASIKLVDPAATVVSSGLAPYGAYGSTTPTRSRINPLTFLEEIYAAGAQGSFDALGWHPYNWTSGRPSEPVAWNAFHQIYATSPSALDLMRLRGDGEKQVWMTEWAYPTDGSTPRSGAYTEQRQAAWLLEGYILTVGAPWAGPLFWFAIEDPNEGDALATAGLVRPDGTPKPSWTAYQDALRLTRG